MPRTQPQPPAADAAPDGTPARALPIPDAPDLCQSCEEFLAPKGAQCRVCYLEGEVTSLTDRIVSIEKTLRNL